MPFNKNKSDSRSVDSPKDEPIEPGSKIEAEKVTGDDPHPGNVSDVSELPEARPQRAEKLTEHKGQGELIAPVTEKADGEKIGLIPGQRPTAKATTTYKYQVVVLSVGPDGDVLPGPDSAAIQACIQAGYRPVAEAKVEGVEDHPDGLSKIVTWAIPCVEASAPEYRDE